MEKKGGGEPSVDEPYSQWKSMVPVLYDWFANHNLMGATSPQLEQATYKNRQRLFFFEQIDGSVPNTLVIANCEIVKPRVVAAEHMSQIWHMIDLIYRPEEEVLAELEKFKSHFLTCSSPSDLKSNLPKKHPLDDTS